MGTGQSNKPASPPPRCSFSHTRYRIPPRSPPAPRPHLYRRISSRRCQSLSATIPPPSTRHDSRQDSDSISRDSYPTSRDPDSISRDSDYISRDSCRTGVKPQALPESGHAGSRSRKGLQLNRGTERRGLTPSHRSTCLAAVVLPNRSGVENEG